MSFSYTAGLSNAGSYIVSGIPFVRTISVSNSSEEVIEFYNVTKNLVIYNDGSAAIRVHFASSADVNVINNNHFYEVSAGETLELDVKCKTVYISTTSVSSLTVSVFASITGIAAARMYALTGQGIDE